MSILGTRVQRREDPALLQGRGRYVANLDDPRLSGALTLSYVRSPIAHAEVTGIDVSEAVAMPGVVAVYTAADLDLPAPKVRLPWVRPEMCRPWLATDRVRFVGEPVAVVVAATAAQALDAAEMVVVDYEPLDVVVDPFAALAAGAPSLFGDTNLACEFSESEPDPELFAGCDVVVEGRAVNQRLAAAPLEGRAVAAVWDGDLLTCWLSSQSPHGARAGFVGALGVAEEQVRVIVPDVGGGFGAKIGSYPEEILVAWIARRLGRPVRWVETRTEDMLALGHGRDQHHSFTIGGSRDGRILAYRLDIVANAGAYPSMAAFLPRFTRLMAPGTYDIARVESNARVVVTNTNSIEAYRGAGRPEATAIIERAVDMFAAEIGMDPVEVRRINLLASHGQPITTVAGATYDAGDYIGALDAVLAAADYDGLRAEQARRRDAGEAPLLGIGVSTYVEITAGGGVPTEYAAIRMESDGSVVVATGSSPHGQGHETVFASLVADELGIDPDRVTVIHGDTGLVARGGGTAGSRSLQLGGAAVFSAARQLVDIGREVASEQFEAAVEDVVFDAGRFHVAGSPAIAVDWDDLAAHAADRLTLDTDFRAPGPTFPFGAHVSVVEVDPGTGLVRIVRHLACDDAGVIVNPLLAEGQRHGGIAQGIAQALCEEFRYDDDGNPQTSTFADYTFISAVELPDFELVDHVTPTPYNPLGAKGIGESGTIGSTPAVQSAVVDALAHLGVRHVDMPATPERVWRAIQDAAALAGG